MEEDVQGRAPVLNTGYHDSLRKQLAMRGCLPGKPHGCPGAHCDSQTHDTETVAKGSSELSLRSLNLVWLITGGPIPSKHTCAHTKHAVHV